MGLFGKRKSKKAGKAEDPPSGVVDVDDDLVKVASVDASEDAASETPYIQHEDDGSETEEPSKIDEILGKISDRATALWATILALWFSLSKTTQVAVAAGAAVGAVTVIAVVAAGGHTPALPAHINVAFVGNSYFYVNDLPRTVEQMGNGHITQDSVIHNSASLLQVIMTGNGMWNKWATKKAMINGVKFETTEGETKYLYDMGSCSVPQMLAGHDYALTYKNQAGTYLNDNQNPCFQQEAYREYHESTKRTKWDFVVMIDQAKKMAFEDTREDALMAFNYTYGPLSKKYHISPVIVQPHAYKSSVSGIDDLTTFTALVMEGANAYKKYLNRRVGLFAHAIVAPVGNAFLAVYEESPSDLWPKLFLDDGVHPSAHGTYLYSLVIYATMTGHMPGYKRVVVDDLESSDIFSTARRLQASGTQSGFPTEDEAAQLYKIAKKVAVKHYKPKSMRGFKTSSADTSFLRSDGSDNVYNGAAQQYQQSNNNNIYNQYYNQAANYGGEYGNNNDGADYGGNYGDNQQANDDGANGNYNAYANNDYYEEDVNNDDANANANYQVYDNYADYEQAQQQNYNYNGDYGAQQNNYNGDYGAQQNNYNGDYGAQQNNYNGDYGAQQNNYNGDYGAQQNNYNGDYGAQQDNYNGDYGGNDGSDQYSQGNSNSAFDSYSQYHNNNQNNNQQYAQGNQNNQMYYSYSDLNSNNDGEGN